ncbi:ABC transporter permease [Paenibacillus sp. IHBB 10380]|uniref:ABC transporter permease n=1 Tax=Paenibacillus sp. IHBB 10380 TaxID=1566358 RepID=UPI0005CF9410|nr:ABC transporter permease [Paenibacillus sp. IHBB 10380]AJS60340.1 ABC transporter [Paenibacillus sp. IHBB 10380]
MNSLTIAWHMIRRIIGTRKGFIGYIILPCIVVSLAVALLGQENTMSVEISYVNLDTGPAGQHLLNELSRNNDYVLKSLNGEEELKEAVMQQKATLGLLIPADFSNDLLQGNAKQVNMFQLSANEATYTVKSIINAMMTQLAETATIIANHSSSSGSSLELFEQNLNEISKHRIGAERIDYNLYAKPGLNNVTGFTLMFMMGLVTSTVKMILDDRKHRTMARVFTAPVRSYEIALGNVLGSFFVGVLQILVILSLSRWVLKYNYEIPFFTHFLILASFMFVAMGIASAVAGLIRNPDQAGMLNSMIITPTCMLGGCFWPLSFMPDYMQKIANFIPQKWTIEAVERIASGGHLTDIWLPLSILGLMAIILLAIGSAILRPSEAGKSI